MRPTPEELEEIRANSRIWNWLEAQRGSLRRIQEEENIIFEDWLFFLGEKFTEKKPAMCPICEKVYVSYTGTRTHITRIHWNFHRILEILKTQKVLNYDKIREPVKRRLWNPDTDEMSQTWWGDEFGRLSLYNKLYTYNKDPEVKDKQDFRARKLLVDTGLLKQTIITNGVKRHHEFKLSLVGETFLANPPTIK